jgi:hypothetical protein
MDAGLGAERPYPAFVGRGHQVAPVADRLAQSTPFAFSGIDAGLNPYASTEQRSLKAVLLTMPPIAPAGTVKDVEAGWPVQDAAIMPRTFSRSSPLKVERARRRMTSSKAAPGT